MDDATPMMRQYRTIKQQHNDAILFFRLGDFYEMFERDAKEVSALLNLTLTARNGVPMCGIPYHAAHAYIARLLKAGKKIAICEQLSLPEGGRGIADRRVVEVISPGTIVEEDYLDERTNNYLACIAKSGGSASFAFVDLSTGEFAATEFPWDELRERLGKELSRLKPREIIVPESLLEDEPTLATMLGSTSELVVDRYPDWSFDLHVGAEALKKHFNTASLKGFGLADDSPAIVTAGAVLEYVADAADSILPHIRTLHSYSDDEYVGLDEATLRNLELVSNMQDASRRFTLLEVVDFSRTSMGARRLRRWLLRPLRNIETIENRLDQTASLYHDQIRLNAVREGLGGVPDLERLAARVAMDRAHARDLLAIRRCLTSALGLDDDANVTVPLFAGSRSGGREAASLPSREPAEALSALIGTAIDEDPSVVLTEGRLIRAGYNDELDRLRRLLDGGKELLDSYLADERAATGIQSLRLKYNRIIGYFFEVSKANAEKVPGHFVRRQSLVGGDRFSTSRLSEIEAEINGARERIVDLERELFLEVRERVKARIPELLDIAERMSYLDCIQSFAHAATVHGWTRPQVRPGAHLVIRHGRHPVVETNIAAGSFVANDTALGGESPAFGLVTGPNMAGKSTYLRQVALIVVLAHVGSFVPAEEADIGIVDRIFCRVGAQDNLARGESTFLVEMTEAALILRAATAGSLVIMDEIGRGTGTQDGLSIARSVSEYLLDVIGARTLFATHFHELTSIENPHMKNLSMQVLERPGEIVFLKKVVDGASQRSYGIHVARLAGVPEPVLRRAEELLSEAPGEPPVLHAHRGTPAESPGGGQPALFSKNDVIADTIRGVELEQTTPLEAFKILERLKRLIDSAD